MDSPVEADGVTTRWRPRERNASFLSRKCAFRFIPPPPEELDTPIGQNGAKEESTRKNIRRGLRRMFFFFMERTGIEPVTSCWQSRRSPS